MQFYNSEIAKQLDNLSEEYVNFDILLKVFVQGEINNYIIRGQLLNKVEFIEKLDKFVDEEIYELVNQTEEITTTTNATNRAEIDKVMKTQGIEKVIVLPEEEQTSTIGEEQIKDFISAFYPSYYQMYEEALYGFKVV